MARTPKKSDGATVGTAPEASKKPAKPDDLTAIKGVGGVLEGKLNKMGVWTYHQIAGWKKAQVDYVNQFLNFSGRIERDEWIKQCKRMAKDSPNGTGGAKTAAPKKAAAAKAAAPKTAAAKKPAAKSADGPAKVNGTKLAKTKKVQPKKTPTASIGAVPSGARSAEGSAAPAAAAAATPKSVSSRAHGRER